MEWRGEKRGVNSERKINRGREETSEHTNNDSKREANQNPFEKFPNFMALTEVERFAFFEALRTAKSNVERCGVQTSDTFGTIHDQYLKLSQDQESNKKKFKDERKNWLTIQDTSISDGNDFVSANALEMDNKRFKNSSNENNISFITTNRIFFQNKLLKPEVYDAKYKRYIDTEKFDESDSLKIDNKLSKNTLSKNNRDIKGKNTVHFEDEHTSPTKHFIIIDPKKRNTNGMESEFPKYISKEHIKIKRRGAAKINEKIFSDTSNDSDESVLDYTNQLEVGNIPSTDILTESDSYTQPVNERYFQNEPSGSKKNLKVFEKNSWRYRDISSDSTGSDLICLNPLKVVGKSSKSSLFECKTYLKPKKRKNIQDERANDRKKSKRDERTSKVQQDVSNVFEDLSSVPVSKLKKIDTFPKNKLIRYDKYTKLKNKKYLQEEPTKFKKYPEDCNFDEKFNGSKLFFSDQQEAAAYNFLQEVSTDNYKKHMISPKNPYTYDINSERHLDSNDSEESDFTCFDSPEEFITLNQHIIDTLIRKDKNNKPFTKSIIKSPNKILPTEFSDEVINAFKECEFLLEKDTNKVLEMFIKKKKRLDMLRSNRQRELIDTRYKENKNQQVCVTSMPLLLKRTARARNTHKTEVLGRPETAQISAFSQITPKFDALSPEERRIFFKTLQEAYDSVLEKNPHKEFLPLEEILTKYKNKVTTVYQATTSKESKKPGKQDGKNVRVRLTLTSADNQRIERQQMIEEKQIEEQDVRGEGDGVPEESSENSLSENETETVDITTEKAVQKKKKTDEEEKETDSCEESSETSFDSFDSSQPSSSKRKHSLPKETKEIEPISEKEHWPEKNTENNKNNKKEEEKKTFVRKPTNTEKTDRKETKNKKEKRKKVRTQKEKRGGSFETIVMKIRNIQIKKEMSQVEGRYLLPVNKIWEEDKRNYTINSEKFRKYETLSVNDKLNKGTKPLQETEKMERKKKEVVMKVQESISVISSTTEEEEQIKEKNNKSKLVLKMQKSSSEVSSVVTQKDLESNKQDDEIIYLHNSYSEVLSSDELNRRLQKAGRGVLEESIASQESSLEKLSTEEEHISKIQQKDKKKVVMEVKESLSQVLSTEESELTQEDSDSKSETKSDRKVKDTLHKNSDTSYTKIYKEKNDETESESIYTMNSDTRDSSTEEDERSIQKTDSDTDPEIKSKLKRNLEVIRFSVLEKKAHVLSVVEQVGIKHTNEQMELASLSELKQVEQKTKNGKKIKKEDKEKKENKKETEFIETKKNLEKRGKKIQTENEPEIKNFNEDEPRDYTKRKKEENEKKHSTEEIETDTHMENIKEKEDGVKKISKKEHKHTKENNKKTENLTHTRKELETKNEKVKPKDLKSEKKVEVGNSDKETKNLKQTNKRNNLIEQTEPEEKQEMETKLEKVISKQKKTISENYNKEEFPFLRNTTTTAPELDNFKELEERLDKSEIKNKESNEHRNIIPIKKIIKNNFKDEDRSKISFFHSEGSNISKGTEENITAKEYNKKENTSEKNINIKYQGKSIDYKISSQESSGYQDTQSESEDEEKNSKRSKVKKTQRVTKEDKRITHKVHATQVVTSDSEELEKKKEDTGTESNSAIISNDGKNKKIEKHIQNSISTDTETTDENESEEELGELKQYTEKVKSTKEHKKNQKNFNEETNALEVHLTKVVPTTSEDFKEDINTQKPIKIKNEPEKTKQSKKETEQHKNAIIPSKNGGRIIKGEIQKEIYEYKETDNYEKKIQEMEKITNNPKSVINNTEQTVKNIKNKHVGKVQKTKLDKKENKKNKNMIPERKEEKSTPNHLPKEADEVYNYIKEDTEKSHTSGKKKIFLRKNTEDKRDHQEAHPTRTESEDLETVTEEKQEEHSKVTHCKKKNKEQKISIRESKNCFKASRKVPENEETKSEDREGCTDTTNIRKRQFKNLQNACEDENFQKEIKTPKVSSVDSGEVEKEQLETTLPCKKASNENNNLITELKEEAKTSEKEIKLPMEELEENNISEKTNDRRGHSNKVCNKEKKNQNVSTIKNIKQKVLPRKKNSSEVIEDEKEGICEIQLTKKENIEEKDVIVGAKERKAIPKENIKASKKVPEEENDVEDHIDRGNTIRKEKKYEIKKDDKNFHQEIHPARVMSVDSNDVKKAEHEKQIDEDHSYVSINEILEAHSMNVESFENLALIEKPVELAKKKQTSEQKIKMDPNFRRGILKKANIVGNDEQLTNDTADLKVALVGDDVISKITRIIQDLEKKAKEEDEGLDNEYLQLLLGYIEYLSRVLASLIEGKENYHKEKKTTIVAAVHANPSNASLRGGKERKKSIPERESTSTKEKRGSILEKKKESKKDSITRRDKIESFSERSRKSTIEEKDKKDSIPGKDNKEFDIEKKESVSGKNKKDINLEREKDSSISWPESGPGYGTSRPGKPLKDRMPSSFDEMGSESIPYDSYSESDSSQESITEERAQAAVASRSKVSPTTNIRILQDLLRGRAELVAGSYSDIQIKKKLKDEMPSLERRRIRLREETENFETYKAVPKSRLQKLFDLLCRCGKQENKDQNTVLESLKGTAVAVDESETKSKTPASATLNESTMDVLKAAQRKRLIEKYWKSD